MEKDLIELMVIGFLIIFHASGETIREDKEELEQEFLHRYRYVTNVDWPEQEMMNEMVLGKLCYHVFKNLIEPGLIARGEQGICSTETTRGKLFLSIQSQSALTLKQINYFSCEYMYTTLTYLFYVTKSSNPGCHYLLTNDDDMLYIASEVCGFSWQVISDNIQLEKEFYTYRHKNYQSRIPTFKLNHEEAYELCMNVYEASNNCVIRNGEIIRSFPAPELFFTSEAKMIFRSKENNPWFPINILHCSFDTVEHDGQRLNEFLVTHSHNQGCVFQVNKESDSEVTIINEVCAVLKIPIDESSIFAMRLE